MGVYAYKCPSCGRRAEQIRSLADRNEPIPCECGDKKGRVMSVPAGLIQFAADPVPAPATATTFPTATMRNVEIDNCGGPGMTLSGGAYAIDGMSITNTPVGIDLRRDARVDVKNVVFSPDAGRRGARRKQRTRRTDKAQPGS